MRRYNVCKRFKHPLTAGSKFNLTISYDLVDCFSGKPTEALLHTVDYQTKRILMEVNFHVNRPARNPRLFLRFSGTARELQRPEIAGLKLTAEINRPRIGAEYELEWEW